MAFEQKTWANYREGGTPITAEELNRMELGIKTNDTHAIGNGMDHADPTTNLHQSAGHYYDSYVPTPEYIEGEVFWSSTHKTLEVITGFADQHAIHVGETMFGNGVNKTGVTAIAGKAVKILGVQGSVLTYEFANASLLAEESDSIGIVSAATLKNEVGPVCIFGLIENMNTASPPSGEDWTEGDKLYLSIDGTGNLTNVQPSYPNHVIWIATVIYVHSSNGIIFVNPLHDYHREIRRAARQQYTTITGIGGVYTIDWSTWAGLYKISKTEAINLELDTTILPDGAWEINLETEDDGNDWALNIPSDWKTVGGAAPTTTSGGIDQYRISGVGTDATTVRLTQHNNFQ